MVCKLSIAHTGAAAGCLMGLIFANQVLSLPSDSCLAGG